MKTTTKHTAATKLPKRNKNHATRRTGSPTAKPRITLEVLNASLHNDISCIDLPFGYSETHKFNAETLVLYALLKERK